MAGESLLHSSQLVLRLGAAGAAAGPEQRSGRQESDPEIGMSPFPAVQPAQFGQQ